MQTSQDKTISFIINSVFILIILVALCLYVFGIKIGNFTFTATGITQEQCNNGYLFLTHKTSNGVSMVQIFDKYNKPIKCKDKQ